MIRLLRRRDSAFSLLEVVVVVAIVAIVAATAIPRMSRGTRGTADAALVANLRILRGAIDRYALEHGGSNPDKHEITGQLTLYTDFFGDAQATMDTTHVYGPYLRKIPPLPVGEEKGSTKI